MSTVTITSALPIWLTQRAFDVVVIDETATYPVQYPAGHADTTWYAVTPEHEVKRIQKEFRRACFESAYSERHKFRMKRKESL